MTSFLMPVVLLWVVFWGDDHPRLPDHEVNSEHFSLRVDPSPGRLNFSTPLGMLATMESTYADVLAFCLAHEFPVRRQVDAPKLRVALFDSPAVFQRYCRTEEIDPGGGAGIYVQRTNMAVFYDLWNHPDVRRFSDEIEQLLGPAVHPAMLDLTRKEQAIGDIRAALFARREELIERFTRLVIRHEIAHQVLFNLDVHVRGADNPVWLVEGLACQFEVPRIGRRKKLSEVNDLRLADLREALGFTADAKRVSDVQWRAAIESGKLVELADLIADDQSLDPNSAHAAYRYAQAWAFVYYLRQEHRDSFTAYLRLAAKRRPGEVVPKERELAEFESCFGRLDNSFTIRWLEYITRL